MKRLLVLTASIFLTLTLAQTEPNAFNYTVNFTNHTVSGASPDAVAGAFYNEISYTNRQEKSWQIILGVRGGEDFLLEKLRIILPATTNDTGSIEPSDAFYLSDYRDSTVKLAETQERWVRSNSETDISISNDRAEGTFALNFGEVCIRGELDVDLSVDAQALNLPVQAGQSEAAVRERNAFNDLDPKGKDLVERGELSWQGYDYTVVPSLALPEATETSSTDPCSLK